MRPGLFLKGRILKEIPPNFAVALYFEVCASEPLGVSHHSVKPQNIGPPPAHTIDTALRKGPWPQTSKTQFFDAVHIRLLLHQFDQ